MSVYYKLSAWKIREREPQKKSPGKVRKEKLEHRKMQLSKFFEIIHFIGTWTFDSSVCRLSMDLDIIFAMCKLLSESVFQPFLYDLQFSFMTHPSLKV